MITGTGTSVTMTDEEFRLLRDLINGYCGITFDPSMKFLMERRLRPRLPVLGLNSFRDYYRMLKFGGMRGQEFDEIVQRITTNETYFFREMYQLKAFIDEVLPDIVENRHTEDRIRIWSAGCSTGEEPYSLAMLLDETSLALGRTFEIFGNDISRKVLSTAREGVYLESSFRQTEPRYRDKYFMRDGRTYRLHDAIRNKVTFGHLNLMDESGLGVIGNVDVIFCRNVIIYFSQDARRKLLQVFHKKLRPGGYLLLGHSETLIGEDTDFELAPLKNDLVYRKPMG